MTPRRGILRSLAITLAVVSEGLITYRVFRAVRSFLRVQRNQPAPVPPDAPASEAVSFHTEDGLLLRGTMVAPRNGVLVVLTHGIGESRNEVWREALILVRAGYGVLAFDFRSHGESQGPGFSTFGELEQRDLFAALTFLEQRGIKRVGALRIWLGGMVVANVAAVGPRIVAVVLEGAFPSVEFEAPYDARSRGVFSELPAHVTHRLFGIHLAKMDLHRLGVKWTPFIGPPRSLRSGQLLRRRSRHEEKQSEAV